MPSRHRAEYLTVEKFFRLILRLTGEVDPELFEYLFVYAGEKNSGMCFRSAKLGKLLERKRRVFIRDGSNSEREKDLVHMEVRVLVTHMSGLELLDGLDDGGREKSRRVIDSCEVLERIEEYGGITKRYLDEE